MFTNGGVAVDAWVKIEGHCSLTCEVVADEAQFSFGHRTGSLELIASEAALETLVSVASDALHRMRADADQDACTTACPAPVSRSAP